MRTHPKPCRGGTSIKLLGSLAIASLFALSSCSGTGGPQDSPNREASPPSNPPAAGGRPTGGLWQTHGPMVGPVKESGAASAPSGVSPKDPFLKGLPGATPAAAEPEPVVPAPIPDSPGSPAPPLSPSPHEAVPKVRTVPRPDETRPPEPGPGTDRTAKGPRFALELEASSGGKPERLPIRLLDPTLETEFAADLRVGGVNFEIRHYSPSVLVQERVVPAEPGEAAPPAVKLEVEADGRKWNTWLVPGSRVLGRAALQSALVEYLPALSPQAFEATERLLQTIHDPEPKILLELKRDGSRHILPAAVGQSGRLSEPAYEVEVLRSFKCFAIDPQTKEPVDQSWQALNPAVEVRVRRGEATRTAWLFSRLPEFSRGAEDEDGILRYVWNLEEHPHRRAELTLVDAPEGPLEAFLAQKGAVSRLQLSVGKPVETMGIRITIEERIPASRIAQLLSIDPSGFPAVLLAWKVGERDMERWIPAGATEELRVGDALFWARFVDETGEAERGRHGSAAPQPGMPLNHPSVGGKSGPRPPGGSPAGSPAGLPAGHPALPPAGGMSPGGPNPR